MQDRALFAHRWPRSLSCPTNGGACSAAPPARSAQAEADDTVTHVCQRWYGPTDAQRTSIAEPRNWSTRATGTICLARLPLWNTVRRACATLTPHL
jgi:hypothetical protein